MQEILLTLHKAKTLFVGILHRSNKFFMLICACESFQYFHYLQ
jgi:hypothetical protein